MSIERSHSHILRLLSAGLQGIVSAQDRSSLHPREGKQDLPSFGLLAGRTDSILRVQLSVYPW